MSRQVSLPHVAIATIAAASLSLSMLMPAPAQQADAGAPPASTTVKKHKRSHYSQNHTYQPAYQPKSWSWSGGCTSYQNMQPPCMSTWPEGSPHYHGGIHPGVTFDE